MDLEKLFLLSIKQSLLAYRVHGLNQPLPRSSPSSSQKYEQPPHHAKD